MKILRLEAENFMKLIAVEITPDGNMVQITGKNAQGKSSVLNAIWVALAGISAAPIMPIREGQDQARIKLDLGEIVVTRVFKQGKTPTLTVENAEGSKISSPQAMLDGLLGQLSFDPLAFERMKPKEQFDALRKFVPNYDFEKHDLDTRSDFTTRTDLNRRAKESRTLAASIVVPIGIPATPADEKQLIDDMQIAAKFNADIETRKSNRAKLAKNILENKERIAKLEVELHDLKQENMALQSKLDSAPPLPELKNVDQIRAKIDSAKDINRQVALREEKAEHEAMAKELEDEADALTESMKKREDAKISAIAAAKLPVKNMSFGDGIILMNGVPFSQASDAERLRASIAIAMASNSKLRVVRVRDGSLLDDDSMKLLAEMADKNDMQVWIEKVESSGKVGIFLEDGMVKSNNYSKELIEGDG